jgi:glucokinase
MQRLITVRSQVLTYARIEFGGTLSLDGTIFCSAFNGTAIVAAAFDQQMPSALCKATIEIMISILASEAGNLALKLLATGGVYLTGGVAVHLLAALQEPQFMHVFTRKGRFEDLMKRTSVHVITTRAALLGAATYGLERMAEGEENK